MRLIALKSAKVHLLKEESPARLEVVQEEIRRRRALRQAAAEAAAETAEPV